MSHSSFIPYHPGVKPYAPRHSEHEWEKHHEVLLQMHGQGCPRREMLQVLQMRGFAVSSGQLTRKMKEWDLMVSVDRQVPSEVRRTSSPVLFEEEPTIANHPVTAAGSDNTRTDDSSSSDAHNVVVVGEQHNVRLPVPFRQSLLDNLQDAILCSSADAQDAAAESQRSTTARPAQILRERALMLEPWSDPFLSQCCCNLCFQCRDEFQHPRELYRLFVEQSSNRSTLKYALALILYAEMRPHGAWSFELQKALREAIEYYLRLCTRVNTKNSTANAILHALLKASNEVEGDTRWFELTTNRRTNLVQSAEWTAHLIKGVFGSKPLLRPVSTYWQGGHETLGEAQAALSLFKLLFPRVSGPISCSDPVHQAPWKTGLLGGQLLSDYDFAAVMTRTSLALESRLRDLRPW